MNFLSNYSKDQYLLPGVSLVLISTLLFINTIGGEFTYDDYQIFVHNKSIHSFHILDIWSINDRPLRALTLMVDYQLFGLNPMGYHVHSMLWHITSVLLLYLLFLKLSADKSLSFIGAALFAAHPIHVEAVTNIANRKEAICLTFALISFLFYIKFCERKSKHYWLWLLFSFFSFYLALHAKQVIIVLPLILLVYEYLFLPHDKKFLTKSKAFLSLTLAVLLLIAFYAIPKSGDFFAFWDKMKFKGTFHGYIGDPTIYNTIISMPKSFIQYIKLLFFPFGLSPGHFIELSTSFKEVETIILWIFFLAFIMLPFFFIRKHRLLAFSLFWFMLNYIPISNVIPLVYYIADRYMYIPSAGTCLLMAIVIRQMVIKPLNQRGNNKMATLGAFLFVFILSFYSLKTVRFNEIWGNRLNLWNYELKINPWSYKGYIGRGTAYADLNNYEEAIKDFSMAISINANAEDGYSHRGNSYLYRGMYEHAIKDFRRTIDLNGELDKAYYNMGIAYHNSGNYEEAMKSYTRSMELNPDFDKVYNNRGNLFNRSGDLKGAIKDYSRAIELNTQYERAYFNRAITYLKINDRTHAERDFLAVIKMNKRNAEAYFNLGRIYLEKYSIDKARPYFRQAAALGYKKARLYLQ